MEQFQVKFTLLFIRSVDGVGGGQDGSHKEHETKEHNKENYLKSAYRADSYNRATKTSPTVDLIRSTVRWPKMCGASSTASLGCYYSQRVYLSGLKETQSLLRHGEGELLACLAKFPFFQD